MKKSLRILSAFNVKKALLAFIAVALMYNTKAQLQSALPIEAYGVWDRTPVSLDDDTYLHLFKGLQLGYNWDEIEPVNDEYNWSKLDQELQFASDNGLYTYLSVNTGHDCPDWVYNTVPKMLTDNRGYGGTEYPYFYHEDYIMHYYDLISDLAAHIASLDPALREKIAFLQVKTACSGDEKPSYGTYLEESPYKLYVQDTEWQEYRIAAFQHHKDAFENAGLNIPFLFQDIDSGKSWQNAAWTWVSENIGTGFGVKGSAYVRGHHLTGEEYFKNQWYDNLVNPTTLPLFSRAEMDQSHTRPLYEIKKPLGFYWGVLSGLNTGLSVFDVTKSAIDAISGHPGITPSLEFFNRFAPEIYPATTKGAYSIFHEGLNATDVDKFPESTFGKASKENKQRYIDICKVYAHRGAQMDDPHGVTKGQVLQRRVQTGYNDAGWEIHDGNYERWIEQIDPDGTSIGLFRVRGEINKKSSIYDRFARSFETATGKNTMYFKFHEDVFSATAGQPDIITLELTWLDKNKNSKWELKYDAGEGNIKTAYSAKGKGDNKWKTIKVVLSDAVMNNNCPNGADFMLVNTDDIDDTFHGFEASISRKISN
ncbi:MAG: beta-galactosidase [Bacteroidales bacterium]|nr:beta-galactosidase [Bacteroidales bacterium]